MRNDRLFIVEGLRIGRITVGNLVRDVREHELYLITPVSYLQQGKLREVTCDCGEQRLIAESILATGRIQSCGCLRREMLNKATEGKIERMRIRQKKQAVNAEIKIQQQRLRLLQAQPVPIRNEREIDECASMLRSLFAQKAAASRKLNSKKP